MVAIVVHELGHLAAARLQNYPVDSLTFGFGSAKTIKTFRSGFKLRVGLIPLGAYLKIDNSIEIDRKHQKLMLIHVSGPLMSVFFALICFALAAVFSTSRHIPSTIIEAQSQWIDQVPSLAVGSGELFELKEVNAERIDSIGLTRWDGSAESLKFSFEPRRAANESVAFATATSTTRLSILLKDGCPITCIQKLADLGIYLKLALVVEAQSPNSTLQIGDQLLSIEGKPITLNSIATMQPKMIRVELIRNFALLDVDLPAAEIKNRRLKITHLVSYKLGITGVTPPAKAVLRSMMQFAIEAFTWPMQAARNIKDPTIVFALTRPYGAALVFTTIDAGIIGRNVINFIYVAGILSFVLGLLNALPAKGLDGGNVLLSLSICTPYSPMKWLVNLAVWIVSITFLVRVVIFEVLPWLMMFKAFFVATAK